VGIDQQIAILRFAKHIKECTFCEIGPIIEGGPVQSHSAKYCPQGFILECDAERLPERCKHEVVVIGGNFSVERIEAQCVKCNEKGVIAAVQLIPYKVQ
jgi:hypothetical protein